MVKSLHIDKKMLTENPLLLDAAESRWLVKIGAEGGVVSFLSWLCEPAFAVCNRARLPPLRAGTLLEVRGVTLMCY